MANDSEHNQDETRRDEPQAHQPAADAHDEAHGHAPDHHHSDHHDPDHRDPDHRGTDQHEEEGAGYDPAAFASLEAIERDEDAPILPVRAVDDAEDEDDEDADEPAEGAAAEAENAGDEQDAEPADAAEDEPAAEGDEDPAEGGGLRKRRRRRGGRGRKKETQQSAAPAGAKRRQLMVVNDVPGEECRIAILEEGRLEQIFAERESTATNVGNIYKGRVMNVEPAIQAAFVDFGEGQNGFLHISDLHPKYFPGGDKTERVGKKIARRDRPPIQEALKRGQEVIVQVLKEGIGTKGPTLTSYVSIPGRLLVMMPQMDKVGVSRKVDDEDQRREMRRILDSLELPEGFGFILRTAGFDRTKTELQRDALYLQRLWEAMERRMNSTGAPCTLYTESDLLVRTIRDIADDSVEAIVVDSESAFLRARTFLQVVAPINAPKLLFYDRAAPLFEAFGVERQVEQIHAREVPLPSGGALVIDQTEAMVAIDVNSGKSRSARDSETNAFNTNKEAVDEIARQLRLRDLGGIIVNDLIDMRSLKHRREIESRFDQNLRRDRAKTTTLEISDFGIVEMTRQRMRPGLHKTQFMDCPHCHGSGEVRVPDAVAADILRRIGLLFCHDRVMRAEVVCSSRVAGVFLSTRRNALHELEERAGKRVDIRISEAFAMDRVDIYAYDDRGADVEVDRLPRIPVPRLAELLEELPESDEDDGTDAPDSGGRRGRRRRRRPAPADATAIALAGGFDDLPTPSADEPSVSELIRRADAERDAKRREDDARRKEEDARRREEDARRKEEEARAREEAARAREEEARQRNEAFAARAAAREARAAERAARVEAGQDMSDLDALDAADDALDAADREFFAGHSSDDEGDEGGEDGRRKRRRRRRGGRGRRKGNRDGDQSGGEGASDDGAAEDGEPAGEGSETAASEGDDDGEPAGGGDDGEQSGGDGEGGRRKRRRRRRRGGRNRDGDGNRESGSAANDGGQPREQGNREPREQGNREPREQGNREPREQGNREPREQGNREPREQGNREPRERPAPAATEQPAPSAPDAGARDGMSAAKKTIRSVTGWMRRLKSPSGSRDDR
ncbi:MAG: Rne/Rng family ribonuclease [Planctomycetes bacterium]|nr:Rne/Rng family ribonuclease [Planctomycetota bacterium]